jgi:hypothetical protein
MKKNYALALVLVLLLVSVFPATVFAGKPADIHVDVRNNTGGQVNLDLIDANGNHIYKTLEAGISKFDLTDGIYSYYASTACGNQSGVLNLGTTKTLFLFCETDAPLIYVAKSCEWYMDYGDNTYAKWQGLWDGEWGYYFNWDWNDLYDYMDANGYSFSCLSTVRPGDIWGNVGQNGPK